MFPPGRETRDEARGHGLPGSPQHDGDGARRSLGGETGRRRGSEDDVDPELDEPGGQGEELIAPVAEAILNRDVTAFDVAQFPQSPEKSRDEVSATLARAGGEEADHGDSRPLLPEP